MRSKCASTHLLGADGELRRIVMWRPLAEASERYLRFVFLQEEKNRGMEIRCFIMDPFVYLLSPKGLKKKKNFFVIVIKKIIRNVLEFILEKRFMVPE